MLQFECPSCKTKLQAAPEHAGRAIVCPNCHTSATVPRADAITAEPIMAVLAPSTAVTSIPVPPTAPEGDRPRRPAPSPAKGMSVGMIVLLVVGIGGCGGVFVVGILIALLVPAVAKVREAERRTRAMNNMKQIGIACHNHHDAFQFLPSPKVIDVRPDNVLPPRTVDLSWRVSLLPFIEQGAVFNQFDKLVAFDHPRNQGLQDSRPLTYDSLWRGEPDGANIVSRKETAFQYFTGPNTVFPEPWTKARIPASFPDGTSNTFLVGESKIPCVWSSPQDMRADGMNVWPLPEEMFLVGMADGSVRFIHRRNVGDGTLRLLIDPGDGQVLPPEAFD